MHAFKIKKSPIQSDQALKYRGSGYRDRTSDRRIMIPLLYLLS